jgi:hypothetical protein
MDAYKGICLVLIGIGGSLLFFWELGLLILS